MPKTAAAKKIAVPIPKSGAKSVGPANAIKKALEAKIAAAGSGAGAPDAVDAKMNNHKSYKVYTNDGKSYSAYLMCADLKNNNNKFYVCQVVQYIANPNNVYFWTRYGRVGDQGVSNLEYQSAA